MKLSDLKLQKEKPEITIIKINGQDVEVYSSISPKDEHDIIFTVLNKSYKDGMYSPYLMKMYLTLFLISNYTNIEFSQEDWEDEQSLYEILVMSGVAAAVTAAIPKETIKGFLDAIAVEVEARNDFNYSMAAQIAKFINQFPELMKQANEMIENFDKEKYQNLIDTAEALNGNRPVPPQK